MTHEYLRICTECPIRHYENCRECFGFGKYVSAKSGDLIPVSAAEAHGVQPLPPNLVPCPECGSTPLGVPDDGTADVPTIVDANA